MSTSPEPSPGEARYRRPVQDDPAVQDHRAVDDQLGQARSFLATHHRAVLVTRRRDGLQTSPVAAGVDSAGRVVISTRSRSAKCRNLRRDPRASLCVVSDSWFGPWLHLDAVTEVVPMPDALALLEDYYRSIAGEHPDWAEYRRVMVAEDRVLLRLTLRHAAGPALGPAAALAVGPTVGSGAGPGAA